MTGIDEVLQSGRPAVGIVDGEGEDAVVTPVAPARELGHRHELDGTHPERGEVLELAAAPVEGAIRA